MRRRVLPDVLGEGSQRPYTRGWVAPWRGQDGPIDDGHSLLGRLALRIEAELLEEYIADTPLRRRRVRQAARLAALAERTLAAIGREAKATRRAATALQAAADRALATLTPKAPPSKSTVVWKPGHAPRSE